LKKGKGWRMAMKRKILTNLLTFIQKRISSEALIQATFKNSKNNRFAKASQNNTQKRFFDEIFKSKVRTIIFTICLCLPIMGNPCLDALEESARIDDSTVLFTLEVSGIVDPNVNKYYEGNPDLYNVDLYFNCRGSGDFTVIVNWDSGVQERSIDREGPFEYCDVTFKKEVPVIGHLCTFQDGASTVRVNDGPPPDQISINCIYESDPVSTVESKNIDVRAWGVAREEGLGMTLTLDCDTGDSSEWITTSGYHTLNVVGDEPISQCSLEAEYSSPDYVCLIKDKSSTMEVFSVANDIDVRFLDPVSCYPIDDIPHTADLITQLPNVSKLTNDKADISMLSPTQLTDNAGRAITEFYNFTTPITSMLRQYKESNDDCLVTGGNVSEGVYKYWLRDCESNGAMDNGFIHIKPSCELSATNAGILLLDSDSCPWLELSGYWHNDNGLDILETWGSVAFERVTDTNTVITAKYLTSRLGSTDATYNSVDCRLVWVRSGATERITPLECARGEVSTFLTFGQEADGLLLDVVCKDDGEGGYTCPLDEDDEAFTRHEYNITSTDGIYYTKCGELDFNYSGDITIEGQTSRSIIFDECLNSASEDGEDIPGGISIFMHEIEEALQDFDIPFK